MVTYTIPLDFPVNSKPRYGFGNPPHQKLYEIINRNRQYYVNYLNHFLVFKEFFINIPGAASEDDPTPRWINGYFSGLDSIALCGFLGIYNPRRYLEVGSGNTTKFARRAINEFGLQTKITSIDPEPRASVDLLCDNIIRQPLENGDVGLFQELEARDMVFVDGSHRVFMNSDATVVFLDILPYLKPGVLVHFHDILLPRDYPPEWIEMYFSEQYLMAGHLLAEGNKFDILLANSFICMHDDLRSILNPIWNELPYPMTPYQSSFWVQMK